MERAKKPRRLPNHQDSRRAQTLSSPEWTTVRCTFTRCRPEDAGEGFRAGPHFHRQFKSRNGKSREGYYLSQSEANALNEASNLASARQRGGALEESAEASDGDEDRGREGDEDNPEGRTAHTGGGGSIGASVTGSASGRARARAVVPCRGTILTPSSEARESRGGGEGIAWAGEATRRTEGQPLETAATAAAIGEGQSSSSSDDKDNECDGERSDGETDTPTTRLGSSAPTAITAPKSPSRLQEMTAAAAAAATVGSSTVQTAAITNATGRARAAGSIPMSADPAATPNAHILSTAVCVAEGSVSMMATKSRTARPLSTVATKPAALSMAETDVLATPLQGAAPLLPPLLPAATTGGIVRKPVANFAGSAPVHSITTTATEDIDPAAATAATAAAAAGAVSMSAPPPVSTTFFTPKAMPSAAAAVAAEAAEAAQAAVAAAVEAVCFDIGGERIIPGRGGGDNDGGFNTFVSLEEVARGLFDEAELPCALKHPNGFTSQDPELRCVRCGLVANKTISQAYHRTPGFVCSLCKQIGFPAHCEHQPGDAADVFPQTLFGALAEVRIYHRIFHCRKEEAKTKGVPLSEVEPLNGTITVREVSAKNTKHQVPCELQEAFGYPSEYPVVERFRKLVHYSLITAYMASIAARGFHTLHLYACPPEPDQDYALSSHPPGQTRLSYDRLQQWWENMLKEAQAQGIVKGIETMFDFVGGEVKRLPYFPGDPSYQFALDVLQQADSALFAQRNVANSEKATEDSGSGRDSSDASGDGDGWPAEATGSTDSSDENARRDGEDEASNVDLDDDGSAALASDTSGEQEGLQTVGSGSDHNSDKGSDEGACVWSVALGGGVPSDNRSSGASASSSDSTEGDSQSFGERDTAQEALDDDEEGEQDEEEGQGSSPKRQKVRRQPPTRKWPVRAHDVSGGKKPPTGGCAHVIKLAGKAQGAVIRKIRGVRYLLVAHLRDEEFVAKIKIRRRREAAVAKLKDEVERAISEGEAVNPEAVKLAAQAVALDETAQSIELEGKVFHDRQLPLEICSQNGLGFDTLARAKRATTILLYLARNPQEVTVLPKCSDCGKLPGHLFRAKTEGGHHRCFNCADSRGDVRAALDAAEVVGPGLHHTPQPLSGEAYDARVRLDAEVLPLAWSCERHIAAGHTEAYMRMKAALWHTLACQMGAKSGCCICQHVWAVVDAHAETCSADTCSIPQCVAIRCARQRERG